MKLKTKLLVQEGILIITIASAFHPLPKQAVVDLWYDKSTHPCLSLYLQQIHFEKLLENKNPSHASTYFRTRWGLWRSATLCGSSDQARCAIYLVKQTQSLSGRMIQKCRRIYHRSVEQWEISFNCLIALNQCYFSYMSPLL